MTRNPAPLIPLLLLGLSAPPAVAATVPTAAQQRALDDYGPGLRTEMDASGVPSWLWGRLAARGSDDPVEAAQEALEKGGAAFRRRRSDRFRARHVERSSDGTSHVRLAQTYQGIPVVGAELTVHMDGGSIIGINGRFVPDIEVETVPALSDAQASAAALELLGGEGATDLEVLEVGPPVVVAEENAGSARLAIPVRVAFAYEESFQIEDVHVDAQSGELLLRLPQVHSVTREVRDGARTCLTSTNPLSVWDTSAQIFHSGKNPNWGALDADPAAGAAELNTWWSGDFYRWAFGRDSWDDAGSPMNSLMHITFRGTSSCSPNNAAWIASAGLMAYGDGDGRTFSYLSAALDVTAHELTHAVTSSTANLRYLGESGALNEGTSDILGESAERYANGTQDWAMGRQIFTPGRTVNSLISNPSQDALRYLSNPPVDCYQSSASTPCSPNWYPNRNYATGCTPALANDYCGVHTNSGIANQFYYLLSEGGSLPMLPGQISTCVLFGNCPPPITGVTVEKAQQIWYAALTRYMGPTTGYPAARTATVQAARDLYGECSKEWISVHDAWDVVGVPGTGMGVRGRSCRQLLANPGFERSSTSWSTYNVDASRFLDSWPLLLSHDGRGALTLGGTGHLTSQSVSQRIALPAGARSATLRAWVAAWPQGSYPTDPGDVLSVTARRVSYDGYPTEVTTRFSGATNGSYRQVTLDLTPLLGTTMGIYVYVGASENEGNQTDFWIDDLSVVVE